MESCCWMVSLPPKHLPMSYARAASRLYGFSLARSFCSIPASPTRQPIVPKIVDRGASGAPRTVLIGGLCPTTSVSSPLPAPAGSFPVLKTPAAGEVGISPGMGIQWPCAVGRRTSQGGNAHSPSERPCAFVSEGQESACLPRPPSCSHR